MLPDGVSKKEVEDVKVIGDWLVHMDLDTNLPYQCINHEIEKTWEIHSKPVTGETYYYDPSTNISVWEVPDELVPVLAEEPALVTADEKQNITDENQASAFFDNSFSGELEALEADPISQTEQPEQRNAQDMSPDVLTNKETPSAAPTLEASAETEAKKQALAKATEIARVGSVVTVNARKC